MEEKRIEKLSNFVNWVEQHLDGDEKGEAQIFLDHLFQGFGHKGVKETGATLEARIRKSDKGVSFADLVWKPIVLIEMKKRGTDLAKHYRQAFDYWVELVPRRPRYVVLCNFDQFWIYDFEIQMDDPVDRISLTDLPHRYGPLAFLFPQFEKPVFGNNQEIVTRQAADQLAICFNSLISRNIERLTAQQFILQVLMTLFSENINLLEKYFFIRLLDDCKSPADTYDLIGGLFSEMNTPGKSTGGRFKGVDYFNGGLFAHPARIELTLEELELLKEAAKFDWSKVRPEIFGVLFEHSLEKEDRHAEGAHFTHPADIMKIITPTIVNPWRERIENAKTLTELGNLLAYIEKFKVLDPACGSGNFLYLAYRELKRLEALIYERMTEYKSINPQQRPFGLLNTQNFYGFDINPFAIELAKVTMMLAHKLSLDELHINENALPLDNLDKNFIVCDALIDSRGEKTPWPNVNVIIGNPPFLGAKRLKPDRGVEYVNKLRKLYPEIPGMADYCVYWLRRTHDNLDHCTDQNFASGRAGLVGTQNIRNNQSRVGGLDYIVSTGTIVEAVDNEPWSGEANVHVSIVNWIKTQDKKLFPNKKKLWFKVDPEIKMARKPRGSGSAVKDYELNFREVSFINSALSDQANVSTAKILSVNTKPQLVFQGITPGHKGFICTLQERNELLQKNPANSEVISPYLIGDEILAGNSKATRYIINFGNRSILESQAYQDPFNYIEKFVLPDITKKAKEEHSDETSRKQQLNRWWLLWRNRTDMITTISKLSRYLVCSRVTKRPIFTFIHKSIQPGDALQVFAFEDDYSFGILQSNIHWQWFIMKCSKLKSDFRYTPESVFDTFPWPQSPSIDQINEVAEAGRVIRNIREETQKNIKSGLRALYRTLELPGKNPLKDANTALDNAVIKAYGFSSNIDILDQILRLNFEVSDNISSGKTIIPPGIPPDYPNPNKLITSDSINLDQP